MSILIVPTEYPTIQGAVNAASSGDTIQILTGNYAENIEILGKDNLTIFALPYSVVIDGSTLNGFGVTGITNNLTMEGIVFQNFTSGIVLKGNNNSLTNITSSSHKRTGFIINGDNNKLYSCRAANNSSAGILLFGNKNLLLSNRLENNSRGIAVSNQSSVKNLIIKNLILDNSEFGIRLASSDAKNNIIYDNIISSSSYGIITRLGIAAVCNNIISNCKITGLIVDVDKSIVIQNTLENNPTGAIMQFNDGYIASNIIQIGTSGMIVIGNNNCIVRNIINNQQCTGLLINGNCNSICCNTLKNNCINLEDGGIDNNCSDKNCKCITSYWDSLTKSADETNDYKLLLNIFRVYN